MHLKLGEVPFIVVSSPALAKDVLSTHDKVFAQRPYEFRAGIISYNFSDIAFAPYGNHWRQLRNICSMELFGPNRVQSFRSIREDELFKMVTSIYSQKGSVINLSRRLLSSSYEIIVRAVFGKINKHNDKFLGLMYEIVGLLGGLDVSDLFPSSKILRLISGSERELRRVHKLIDEITETIIKEHRDKRGEEESMTEERKEDLVDVLLDIQKRSDSEIPLTDSVIKAVIYDIFAAGGETSSTTMESAFSEMIRNPQVLKRAQEEVRNVFVGKRNVEESSLDELRYLQAVVKETLRLHPAVPLLIQRESSEKCELNGFVIPAKTRALVNAWAINRDPTCWIEPEKFDPERFLDGKTDYRGNHFEYIPFGGGRRICAGISFAIPKIELALAQLLFHFDWKLPGEIKAEELDMTEKFGITVRRKNDLMLIPVPYAHSCLNSE